MKTQVSYTYTETMGDLIQDRPVLKFHAEDAVSDVLNRIKSSGQKVAGVVDVNNRLIGMITESSILRRMLPRTKRWPANSENIYKLKAVENLIVWDVMIAGPDTLHIDDRIEDASDVMTYLSHRYMPVINSEKQLMGVVSSQELRDALEKKYGALKSLDDPISLYMIQQKLGDLNLSYSLTY